MDKLYFLNRLCKISDNVEINTENFYKCIEHAFIIHECYSILDTLTQEYGANITIQPVDFTSCGDENIEIRFSSQRRLKIDDGKNAFGTEECRWRPTIHKISKKENEYILQLQAI